jgi:protein-S-isoprenylcysteine O-methyltransferase Ste14
MNTFAPRLGPRGEGWVVLQFVLFGAIAVAGISALQDGPIEIGVRALIAAALIAVGLAVASLGVWELRHDLTAFPKPIEGNHLVEAGPYRWIRHPMYIGIVVAGIGWSVVTGSWLAFLLSLILLGLFDAKSRREEVWLADRHPDYAAYRQRTRRFVPGLY